MKNLTLGLCVLALALAGCSSATQATLAPLPTQTPYPTNTPYPTYTAAPAVAPSQQQSIAPMATIALTNTTVLLNIDRLPGPGFNGSGTGNNAGVWRFYDPEAQVICYIYGDYENLGNGAGGVASITYSGMSCLPISQTALGK